MPCKLSLDFDFDDECGGGGGNNFCAGYDFSSVVHSLNEMTPRVRQTTPRPGAEKRKRAASHHAALEVVCDSPREKRRAKCLLRAQSDTLRARRGRCVQFQDGTKQFDGLQPESEALELTVWNFYQVQNIHTPKDILTLFKSNPRYDAVFSKVCVKICNLAQSLCSAKCPDSTIPVLPRGGGRGLLLGQAHAATLGQLSEMFVSATKLS